MSKPVIKVAIYCRKSTEEGLDREFNSLDAQRQCCEQFVASQKGEGWVVSSKRYDDGGFSGSNTERPALQRLLADVEAGTVQVIAVYKLDRLSRSLTDFVGLLQVLEKHQVAFVSVTQHFNTATPMGRLMLNILICFAQFERENMIERVRDKVAATKRLGKWCGGRPSLGYDVAPGGRKLLVNQDEAEQVRTLFALYLERRSIAATLQEVTRRGWVSKRTISATGRTHGGKPFTKSGLAHLLGNTLYTGRVLYQGEIFPGEHPAIIDIATFEEVQRLMAGQRRTGGSEQRIKHHALLRGVLRCGSCDCGMTYSWSRKGAKTYGYYTCARSREHGAATCPMPNVPAAEIERLVVDEVAAIAKTPEVIEQVVGEAIQRHAAAVAELRHRLDEAHSLAEKAAAVADRNPTDPVQAGLRTQAEAQVTSLVKTLALAEAATPDKRSARRALANFEPVWATLSPRERHDFVHQIFDHVTLDGHAGKLSFAFRPEGIAGLANLEPTA